VQINPPDTRRPFRAALLSAIVPGAGQIYAGARRRGWIMLAIDGLIAAGMLTYLLRGELEIAKDWVRPGALAVMMLTNLAFFSYRLGAARDAYYLSGGGTSKRGSSHPATVFGIAVALLVPHIVFGYYDAVQYNFITTVFQDEDVAAPTSTTIPSTVPPSTVPGVTVAAPTTTTTAPAPAIWDGLERLNVLLLGGDAGVGRTGIRTDTMIVVSIDPDSGDIAMFSLPRNFVRVPLPAGHGVWECNCFPKLLNDLYIEGSQRPEAFPGPGTPEVNAVKGGIGELLGIPIHYYMLVTLDSFVGIVDALGGVEMDVQFRVVDEIYPHEDGVTIESVVIEPGLQKLDGHYALAYARIRRHTDDYARMNRQRCVLDALVEQSNPAEIVKAYPRIASVLEDTLLTDIPISRLDDFIDLLPKIDTERISTIRFIPPTYVGGQDERGKDIPDVELIHHDVQVAITNPSAVAVAELGLEALEETCS
jgi:LCP family protein required for cell wall assembly